MTSLLLLNLCLFGLAIAGLLVVFLLYPATLFLLSRVIHRSWTRDETLRPSVSLIVALRNAAQLAEAKRRNVLELDYPAEKLNALFFLDGSEDETEEILRAHADDRVRVLGHPAHRGKISALNDAVGHADGEVLVFTDADALLAPDAVAKLVRHFADPSIGGVCGQRVIGRDESTLKDSQRKYIRLDSTLKTWESRLTSIPSNDGKLYAIRRELFHPILEGVTDDLYVCLSVVEQGRRFVFDGEAVATIPVPSRSPGHEVRRRRRIVSQSLRGIWAKRALLNPFRAGLFACAFCCNRVLRRFLPLFLLLLLFYTLAGLAPVAAPHLKGPAATIGKLMMTARYFCLGCIGTGLGMLDFLRGRSATRWTPEKSDG